MGSAVKLPQLDVHSLLRDHHLTPKKGLGQNFLVDSSALEKITAAAEIAPSDSVLEIGPGLGSLTRHLARAAKNVVAVEIDRQMIPILEDVLRKETNVRIVQGDMLEQNPVELMGEAGYLVVANIPYYITSAIIRHLLEASIHPARIVLTMQREVADRICAQPGDMSLLALSVQVYGKPRPVVRIPAGAFYPAPTVDSVTLRVDIFPEPCIPTPQLNTFFQLAKAGFSQKRKTLRNTISAGMHIPPQTAETILRGVEIDPSRRAETLSIGEWAALTRVWSENSVSRD